MAMMFDEAVWINSLQKYYILSQKSTSQKSIPMSYQEQFIFLKV